MKNNPSVDSDGTVNPRVKKSVNAHYELFSKNFTEFFSNYLESLESDVDLSFLASYGKKHFEKEMKSLEKEILFMVNKVSEATIQEIYRNISKSIDDPNTIY